MSDLDILRPEVRSALGAIVRADVCRDPVPTGAFDTIRAELLRLAEENAELKEDAAICREAVEDAVRFVDYVDSYNDDDTQAAGRRCTKRRLSEAMGKACPRLLHERPEGQKFYGLHYKELRERAERAEVECRDLHKRLSDMRSERNTIRRERAQEHRKHAREKAELAALKARIAESPVYEIPLSKPKSEDGWARVIESVRNERSVRGKRVRLVVEE